MEVQKTVFYIILITVFLLLLFVLLNRKLQKFNPLDKPTGIVLALIMGYDFVVKLVKKETNSETADILAPYFASQMIYIFFASIAGLFGLETPTSNFSVTLTISLITCILIEVFSYKFNGKKQYIKKLFEPVAPFVVINIISKFSTLASLSLRMFVNIMSGGLMMQIIYSITALVSSYIPLIGKFNIFGVIIAPVLHAYFDLFSAGMQTYLFTVLSVIFIGTELPESAKTKEE